MVDRRAGGGDEVLDRRCSFNTPLILLRKDKGKQPVAEMKKTSAESEQVVWYIYNTYKYK